MSIIFKHFFWCESPGNFMCTIHSHLAYLSLKTVNCLCFYYIKQITLIFYFLLTYYIINNTFYLVLLNNHIDKSRK